MAFFHLINTLDKVYFGLSVITFVFSLIGFISPCWIERYQTLVPMTSLGLWGVRIDSESGGYHFERDHVHDRTWRGWYFYYERHFYLVWQAYNTNYFIMIQFLATLTIILELVSFILLAIYYLAPSQSKASKAKSVLALNRARSTATLGGNGVPSTPGAMSKSMASLATTGAASGVTSSLRAGPRGAPGKPSSSIYNARSTSKSAASMNNLSAAKSISKSVRSFADKSKSMMSIDAIDYYKPKTPVELVQRRLRIYYGSAFTMLAGSILGMISSIMFGTLHKREWLSGRMGLWKNYGFYSWGFGSFILGSIVGLFAGNLGWIHIRRLKRDHVTNPLRRRDRNREMSIINDEREMLKDFREDEVEEEEEEEEEQQGWRRPNAPPPRNFGGGGVVAENGSGGSGKDSGSAKLSGSATESARDSDGAVGGGSAGSRSGGSRGDIDAAGAGKDIPAFKDRKSVSSSLRPMTGSLDSHKVV